MSADTPGLRRAKPGDSLREKEILLLQLRPVMADFLLTMPKYHKRLTSTAVYIVLIRFQSVASK